MNTLLHMLFTGAKKNATALWLLLMLLTALTMVAPVLASSGATGNSG